MLERLMDSIKEKLISFESGHRNCTPNKRKYRRPIKRLRNFRDSTLKDCHEMLPKKASDTHAISWKSLNNYSKQTVASHI